MGEFEFCEQKFKVTHCRIFIPQRNAPACVKTIRPALRLRRQIPVMLKKCKVGAANAILYARIQAFLF